MSRKIRFFYIPTWTTFSPKLGAASDEHGKRFHQNISTTEEKYAQTSSHKVLADCCWNLTEEVSIATYRRMSYRNKF